MIWPFELENHLIISGIIVITFYIEMNVQVIFKMFDPPMSNFFFIHPSGSVFYEIGVYDFWLGHDVNLLIACVSVYELVGFGVYNYPYSDCLMAGTVGCW